MFKVGCEMEEKDKEYEQEMLEEFDDDSEDEDGTKLSQDMLEVSVHKIGKKMNSMYHKIHNLKINYDNIES